MNTEEIDRTIRRRVSRFDGVFSCDQLPPTPHLLVCNTDPSTRPGMHWIAIYVDDEGLHGEYFDSLGQPPSPVFEHYMNAHCREWIYNERQLQSVISRFCGHYCVYFCLFRSRDVDMRRIVRVFTNDTGFNDVLVHEMICKQINA